VASAFRMEVIKENNGYRFKERSNDNNQ